MKRIEFYRAYYNRTDRVFSDRIVFSKSGREEAWKNGQHLTSKLERKIFILFQYLVLTAWLPALFNRELWPLIPICLLGSFILVGVTDFSVVKIERLYRICRRNDIYSENMKKIFFGKFSGFLNDLRRATRRKVNAYAKELGGYFKAKYTAYCRNKNDKVTVIFTPRAVKVTVGGRTGLINDASLSREALISEIAKIINSAE